MGNEATTGSRRARLPEHEALDDTIPGDLQPEETRPGFSAPPVSEEWDLPDTGIRNSMDMGTPIEGVDAVMFRLPAKRRTLPTGQIDVVPPQPQVVWTPAAIGMLVALIAAVSALVVMTAVVTATPPVDTTTSYSGAMIETAPPSSSAVEVTFEPLPGH